MNAIKAMAGAAALLVLGLPAVGQADPMMGHGMGEGMPALHLLLRAAQLTPDQRNQVHDIMRGTRESMRPLRQQMKQLHEQLADRLAAQGTVTLADLAPIQQQLEGLHQQMVQAHLKAALQIRALLTPDQLSRVAAAHQKMRQLHQQMEDLMGAPEGPEGAGGEMGPPPMP